MNAVVPWSQAEPGEVRWKRRDGEPLSSAQQAVAEAIVAGMSRGDVATVRQISGRTYDTHRGHVMRKLRITTDTDLVILAIANRWVDFEKLCRDRGVIADGGVEKA